ncbi:MAG: J domain-containing protein [Thermomonas sp.]
MSPFETLGLDDAADIPAIKRAYAKRLRNCRPDEDPAGFQRLHEAYEACLEQVRWRAISEEADLYFDEGDAAADVQDDARGKGDVAPAAAQADAGEAKAEGFAPERFFDEFLPVARDGRTDIDAWLAAHPALYSIADKELVADALVWRLLDEPPLPPRALAATLRHFELDQINPRYQFHEDAIKRLREDAAVAHGEIDLSFMDDRRPRATQGGRSWWWLVWIVFLIAHAARLFRDQ